jgi:hypothetical protein
MGRHAPGGGRACSPAAHWRGHARRRGRTRAPRARGGRRVSAPHSGGGRATSAVSGGGARAPAAGDVRPTVPSPEEEALPPPVSTIDTTGLPKEIPRREQQFCADVVVSMRRSSH